MADDDSTECPDCHNDCPGIAPNGDYHCMYCGHVFMEKLYE